MSQLIDDVMDFARGRLGPGLGIAPEPVGDLTLALRDVVSELREANPGRAVLDTIAIDGTVCCDRGRVQQLLSNLLGNALMHGAQESPVLVAGAIEHDALVLWVTNSGKAIASGDLQKVFEPYWRPATSKPGGGLGLGLYICSQIVKAHGGTLDVTSSETAGTCFVARLPIRATC
jgi:signal transduction histidine kinase